MRWTQKIELRAQAALVGCHRFISLKKKKSLNKLKKKKEEKKNNSYEVRFLEMVEQAGNFSFLQYEAIFYKLCNPMKCPVWGLLVSDGIIPFRVLQRSTDVFPERPLCFTVVPSYLFQSAFWAVLEEGKLKPVSVILNSICNLSSGCSASISGMARQDAACYLVAAWTEDETLQAMCFCVRTCWKTLILTINMSSSSDRLEASLCYLTWFSFYCLNHEWFNMYLFLFSWGPCRSWDIK